MELLLTLTACISLFGLGALIYFLGQHLTTMHALNAMGAEQSAPLPLAERYRPMLRLLAEDDFRYLAAVGWTQPMLRKARAERRRLFRGYLRSLVKDYSRLFAGLRWQMVHSATDRPDLARALSRNRALFTMRLLNIELRLALNAAGVCAVDVSGLVQVVESLRSQGAQIAGVAVPALG